MTLPPIEPRKHYIESRVDQLIADDDRFIVAVALQFEDDPHGPACFNAYAKAKATEQAEREWAERMDVLLEADINNLELHDDR